MATCPPLLVYNKHSSGGLDYGTCGNDIGLVLSVKRDIVMVICVHIYACHFVKLLYPKCLKGNHSLYAPLHTNWLLMNIMGNIYYHSMNIYKFLCTKSLRF